MGDGWDFMPPGEPIPGKTYRADGWSYRDAPTWFTPEMWDYFLSIIGEGNYVVLAMSERTAGDGTKSKRGQFIISPQGMENMRSHGKGVN